MLSGSSFRTCGAWAQKVLSPNLFRLVCAICNKVLVFDLGVLVLACLTIDNLAWGHTFSVIQALLENLLGHGNIKLSFHCPVAYVCGF